MSCKSSPPLADHRLGDLKRRGDLIVWVIGPRQENNPSSEGFCGRGGGCPYQALELLALDVGEFDFWGDAWHAPTEYHAEQAGN